MSESDTTSSPNGRKVAKPLVTRAETLQFHGCTVVLRSYEGPEATELFCSCTPPEDLDEPEAQAEAIYRALLTVLLDLGGGFNSIIRETVFLRNMRVNLDSVREARRRVVSEIGEMSFGPSMTEIEQPPVDKHALLEVSIEAVIPIERQTRLEPVEVSPNCDCYECSRAQGLAIHSADMTRFYSGSLYGRGENVYQQTLAVFEGAEKALQEAGMQFSDVVRTWIYLPDMERDYADLNRGRREFFKGRNIAPPPASTGIGAGLAPDEHDLCLIVYAIKDRKGVSKSVMMTPTLNEAPHYGADFSRGMRVTESNKESLYVSGTASLNETGASVYYDDLEAQAERMLLNVEGLLKAQGAGFEDIVYATTYVKNIAHAKPLQEKLDEAGYVGFVNSMVLAPVCRPELLCETEAVAIVRKGG